MRNSALWLASVLLATLVFEGFVVAQPPPGRRGPPGPGGRGPGISSLERAVDEMKLSREERDTALTAVRAYQDNVRNMTDLAGSSLLLKMKTILSQEEFRKIQETTDRVRVGPGGPRRPGVDDVVDRIMSFDKNKDGKVTKDELPERLQYLVEKGDTNKDGALDRDEIRKLAGELANDRSLFGGGRPGRGRPGAPPGPGIAGTGLSFGVIERAVDDLKLSEGKKEAAAAAIKAHKEDARKLTELARSGLKLQMGRVLKAEDLEKFTAALDRQPGVGDRPGGPGGPGGPPRPPRPRE
jgi:hypothetical protein